MDSTSGLAWDELNVPEINARVETLVLRLEQVVASLVADPDQFTENKLPVLRECVEALDRPPALFVEALERKNAALAMLQSHFGHPPHEVREMVEVWEERLSDYVSHLEQLHKDCDELCTKMEADQSDAGADELILQTLQKNPATFDEHFEELLTRLEIAAIAGDTAGLREFVKLSRAMWLLGEGGDMSIQRLTLHRNFKVKKPLINDGELAYAYSASDAEKADGEPWRMATIKSHRELGSGHGYGPIRMYTVHFHHKPDPEEIIDYEVNTWGIDKYDRAKTVGTSNSDVVKRGFDESSKDLWAKQIGWFVALPGEEELHFPRYLDALAAYDARVIECHGLNEGVKEGFVWDGQWNEYQERASNKKTASDEAKARCHLRLRVILMKEVLPEGDMKLIGDVLVEMTGPDHPLMDPNGADIDNVNGFIAYAWRRARIYYLQGCEQLMRKNIFNHALLKDLVDRHAKFEILLMMFIEAAGNLGTFLSHLPHIGSIHGACSSLYEMIEYLDCNTPEAKHIDIRSVHRNGITSEWNVNPESQPLQGYLKAYATQNNTTVKSLRLKYDGRTIFLSSIRDKSPGQLGMTDGTLEVTFIQSTSEEERPPKPKSQPSNKKSKGKKKHRKSNKKRSTQPASFENEGAKLKERHSQSLSNVFEEADATFRSIRQKLEAMNLERTLPKEKRSRPKRKDEPAEPIDNPPADGLAGKAGRTHFIVQVGETNNLYNTRGSKQSAGRIAREIDLHGCTQEEALSKLDECLPEWVDTAMKGEYPWVITAKIVCGGGSQVLSEAVEGWIKRNPNVSNAPKNLYS